MGLFKGTTEQASENSKVEWDFEEKEAPKEEIQYEMSAEAKEAAAFDITEDNFGPIYPLVSNPHVTDVDFNCSKIWVTYDDNRRECVDIPEVTEGFIDYFANRVAINQSQNLNPKTPSVETETKELRISVLHKSSATNGTSVCIRKTPPYSRISESSAIENLYCNIETLSLLANCIKAHQNIIFCGAPRAGKTECAKFLSTYIPESERVITVESVQELRYGELRKKIADDENRPCEADCVEIKTNDDFDYVDAIIASLKQNPRWIMIAETRGEEVKNLIQGFSTGVNGITTLHTDDVRKIPQRMLNMINDTAVEERFLKNIYEFVNVGVMINIDLRTGRRYIDQIGFFSPEKGDSAGRCTVVVQDGRLTGRGLPENIKEAFERADIDEKDIFNNADVLKRLERQGIDPASIERQKVKTIDRTTAESPKTDNPTVQLDESVLDELNIPSFN